MNLLRFHWITLIAIYLVVIAGSVVRMTGSGMGCPDWPKCFDQYIPPTSVESLPENYQSYYSSVREKKIKKFSNFLLNIGLKEKSNEILADKSLLYEQPFNVWNTWFEYVNRLIGAIAGLLIFIGFLVSIFSKENKIRNSLLSFGLIVLTAFQAWWGSMVVATNIVPWVLTVHMVIAAIMIAWQIFIISYCFKTDLVIPFWFKIIIFLGGIFFLFQIIIGTQVRQIVDYWIKSNNSSPLDFGTISIFISHRTTALILTIYSLLLIIINYRNKLKLKEVYLFFALILLEGFIGKILSAFNIPIALQPLHLLLAMLSFGCLVSLIFNYRTS